MIYCVEDERNIRELIVYTLESSGFTARGLESGKELNAAIAEQLPDLILLDIMLPGDDGYARTFRRGNLQDDPQQAGY